MKWAGVLESAQARPPTHAPSPEENEVIRIAVANAGLLK
jgi:hypothetical protein